MAKQASDSDGQRAGPPARPGANLDRIKRDASAWLMEKFPLAFPAETRLIRPLAVGVHHQVLVKCAEMACPYPSKVLRQAMRWWFMRPAYLKALTKADARINLDGSSAGAITNDDRRCAVDRCKALAIKVR